MTRMARLLIHGDDRPAWFGSSRARCSPRSRLPLGARM